VIKHFLTQKNGCAEKRTKNFSTFSRPFKGWWNLQKFIDDVKLSLDQRTLQKTIEEI
jgi:hypothetical protein